MTLTSIAERLARIGDEVPRTPWPDTRSNSLSFADIVSALTALRLDIERHILKTEGTL